MENLVRLEFGDGFKLQILVEGIGRPLSNEDSSDAQVVADELIESIKTRTAKSDLIQIKEKERLLIQFKELFGGRDIFIQEIPNRYCSKYCCSMKPWYHVTTSIGAIELGRRKRVISITWWYGKTAEELFPNEDVTKFDRTLHAWSLEKAKEYIDRIINDCSAVAAKKLEE